MERGDRKDVVMSLKVSDEQKRMFKDAAYKNDMSVNAFLIKATENEIINQEAMNKRLSDKKASARINTKNVGVMQDLINNICRTVYTDHPDMCDKMEEFVDEFWDLL